MRRLMTPIRTLSLLIVTSSLTACTLNYRGNEQDYDIDATMESSDCSVRILRREVRTEKKVDANKPNTD